MPQITIIPSSPQHPTLQPIVLSHPTPTELADILSTLRSNGIPYSINYGKTPTPSSSFSYPLAATYTSR